MKLLFECWKIFHEWKQRTSEICFQHEKRNLVSPSGHVMFYLLYKHQDEMQNHFTLIVFWCERRDLLWSHSNGNIFTCEDNMLFSHVKISSFRMKAHLVIHWCLYSKIIMITHTQSVLHHSPQEVGFPGYYPLVSLRIHHCNIWEPLQIRMTDSIALDHLLRQIFCSYSFLQL